MHYFLHIIIGLSTFLSKINFALVFSNSSRYNKIKFFAYYKLKIALQRFFYKAGTFL